MSWRTQGQYKGLCGAERAYLKAFDSDWDLKRSGRSRGDALDHRAQFGHNEAAPLTPKPAPGALDLSLIQVAREQIDRFTVPHSRSRGYCIILTLKNGKRVRAHFKTSEQACDAYELLLDLSQFVSIAYGRN